MQDNSPFHLADFMPYLLNRAAEATSLEFQKAYKGKYGMLRTEWRVLFHLGRYGSLTAKDICNRANLHKTKVSRAVAALEARRFVDRTRVDTDRRHALLSLTKPGQAAFADLVEDAERYNTALMQRFTRDEADILRRALIKLADQG